MTQHSQSIARILITVHLTAAGLILLLLGLELSFHQMFLIAALLANLLAFSLWFTLNSDTGNNSKPRS